MSTGRRLARLEGTLTPKAATLLWLSDAHAFGTLPPYVAWLVDQRASAAPLYRVPQAAEAGMRAAMRSEKREAVERAVRDAARQAVFLVELVITLNTAAEETVRLEGLRYAALLWEKRAISAEAQLETSNASRGSDGKSTSRWPSWHTAVADLMDGLFVAGEARTQLERRYLDGVSTLFPGVAREWQRLREDAETLSNHGNDAEEHPVGGCRRASSGSIRSSKRSNNRNRAQAESVRLADIARSTALDLLGDTDGAAVIATRHLET